MQDTNERHGSGVAVWFFRTLLLLAAAVVMTVALVQVPGSGIPEQRPPARVIPLGRAVGIKLFAQGVLVVGLSDITTDQGLASPAGPAGSRRGTSSPTSMTPRSAPLRRSRPYSRTWKARKWN